MSERTYTEAQKRASKKYDSKYDSLRVRLPKGTADRIRALGISCNAFVMEATLEKLNKLDCKGDENA